MDLSLDTRVHTGAGFAGRGSDEVACLEAQNDKDGACRLRTR